MPHRVEIGASEPPEVVDWIAGAEDLLGRIGGAAHAETKIGGVGELVGERFAYERRDLSKCAAASELMATELRW